MICSKMGGISNGVNPGSSNSVSVEMSVVLLVERSDRSAVGVGGIDRSVGICAG